MTSPTFRRIAIGVTVLSMSLLLPATFSSQSRTPEPEVISTVGGVDLMPGGTEPAEGVIESPDHEAAFWFDAVSGDHVRLHAAATDRSLDPVLELFGPGGVWLETDDDSLGFDATIDSQLGVSGRYQVIVRSAGYGPSCPEAGRSKGRSRRMAIPTRTSSTLPRASESVSGLSPTSQTRCWRSSGRPTSHWLRVPATPEPQLGSISPLASPVGTASTRPCAAGPA
jgi:hypothetical protein